MKTVLCFFAPLLFLPLVLLAQEEIPSLKTKMKQLELAKNWSEYTSVALQLAHAYEQINQMDSAAFIWQKTLTIKGYASNKVVLSNQALALDNLLMVEQQAYRMDKAIQYANQAIEKRENLGDEPLLLAENYRKLGICHFINRDFEQGLPFVFKCLEMFKQNANKTKDNDWFRVYNSLGGAYGTLGDFKKSNQYLEKALRYSIKVFGPKHPRVAVVYDNMSKNYIDMDRPEEGIHFFDEALKYALKAYEINKAAGDLYQMSRNSVYLGQLYVHHSDFDKALEWYTESLPILQQVFGKKHPEVGLAYFEMAKVYDRLERNVENVKKSMHYVNKAVLALLPLYQDSLAQLDPSIVPTFYQEPWTHNYYLFHSLNHKASTFLDLSELTNDLGLMAIGIEHIDSLYMLCEKQAMDAFNNQDAMFDLKEQYYAFGVIIEATEALYEHYKDEKYLEKGFLYSERIKGFWMKNATQTKDALSFGAVPDSLVLKLQNLKNELEDLKYKSTDAKINKQSKAELEINSALASKQQDYQKLIDELEQDYPRYHNYRYNNTYPTIKEVQAALLDEETLLIEYSSRELGLAVMGISKDHVTANSWKYDFKDQQDKDIAELRKLMCNYQAIRANPKENYRKYCQTAYQFYQRYLEPVLKAHPNKKKLIIVADGYFSRIPFGALLTQSVGNEKEGDFSKLPYLIKDYSVQYAYSASLLMENKNQTKANAQGILGVAASYLGKEKDTMLLASRGTRMHSIRELMADLPGAKEEVEVLENLYQGDFYYGNEANEAAFKSALSKPYSVVHLAMHGFMDTRESLLSCLLFTDNGDTLSDNNLYAGEITQLNVQSNLVVLSACETADGQWEKAEGLMSLGRSFMYAGAPAVLMSLWQVNDAATSIIMQDFYLNLSKGLAKDEALRQAKLSYLEQVDELASHPAFWAAFIQLGDASAISVAPKRGGLYWFLGLGMLAVLGGAYFYNRNKQA